jgi:tetratricopeptide (TPR) repeat protein
MSEPVPGSPAAGKSVQRAVFLSYASEDAPAAEKICTALRAAGVEVWFDRSELRGGDAWDAMIRRQIKTCALFIPVISANSHSRAEGYFRLEWKLAVDRSHLIAADRAFLLPVVIDATPEDDERIPERFRELQWTHLPGGDTPPAFPERVARLLAAAEPARASLPTMRHGMPAPEPAPLAPAPVPRPAVAAVRPWWSRPPLLAAALLGGALVLCLGWLARHHLGKPAAVAPYSLQDRRMTFAVLPFTAAAEDARSRAIAAATRQAVQAHLESDAIWTHVTPSRSVDEAVARFTTPKDLAKALDVHFLIRGSVEKAAAGDSVAVHLIDGSNERVLSTASIDIPADSVTPRWHDSIVDAYRHLWFPALETEVKSEAATPVDQLDVRGLTFRAFSSWRAHRGAEAKEGYTSANELLKRALHLAPDDPAATWLMAEINLCDCVLAWSHNVEEQKAIGAAALEKSLQQDPNNSDMLVDKAELFQLRGKYDESLVVLDQVLQRDPGSADALATRAVSLLRLGRAKEALPIVQGLVARYPTTWPGITALNADVEYALGNYPAAVQLARNAIPRTSEEDLRSPIDGSIRLTLAAAQARLGDVAGARATLADFNTSVPNVTTIAQIKKWLHPTADLYGFEPLFDGLRLAGVKE